MTDTIRAVERSELERFAAFSGGGEAVVTTAAAIAAHGADEHWMVLGDGGEVRARCSLWWSAALPYGDEQPGAIGHYAARDAEAAAALLDTACRRLAEEGRTLAVGPMDGNTWRRYRFVTDPGTEPPFLMDLVHPPEWPHHFTDSGFTVEARYISTLNPDTGRRGADEGRWRRSVADAGVTLRRIDMGRFEAELEGIFEVALAGFARNLFYTPIDRRSFMAMYLPFADRVCPELVLIAERGDDAVGFIFCIPDLLQAERGGEIDTVVLKTFAVRPDATGCGLGGLLAAQTQRIACELGYRRYIYAFMHEDNPSAAISARYARPIRRYALFAKRLRP